LWNKETTTYSDNNSFDSAPHIVAIYTVDGTDGDDGRGLVNIQEKYLVNNSISTPSYNENWQNTI